MKKNIYILILLLLTSCEVLDKKPLGWISDDTVWSDPVLVDSYLSALYAKTPVFTNDASSLTGKNGVGLVGMFYVNELSDECTYNWGYYNRFDIANFKGGDLKVQGGLLEYWELPYSIIRAINVFLDKIESSPIDGKLKTQRSAEARFLRAFNYFAMVKRYGGVPIIKKAQSLTDTQEELYPKRNSEQEVYDYILQELDEIADDLPVTNSNIDYGRPCKYAALALKSRVALYAGSIAKYGKVQLNGLLGFPDNTASNYFKKAYDAAKTIITDRKYGLYNKDADKTTNFKNIFLVKNNEEVILAKKYDGITNGGVAWGYDFAQAPKPHAWNAGNKNAPYLEMVEEFETIHGESGKLDLNLLTSKLWSMSELWGQKDPRFHATIYTQDTPWKGNKVEFYNAIIREDGTLQTEGSYKGVLARGNQSPNNIVGTSFGVMKYLDPKANNLEGVPNSKTDYIVLRYAEVLLNFAEAAMELGKTDEALAPINLIRKRAGIPDKKQVTMDDIRHERKVELAFEGHRYWDLKRWRIAETVLTGGRTGIRYLYDYASGKYKVNLLPNVETIYGQGGKIPLFRSYYYYFPITLKRTGSNSNLIENPGY